MCVAQSAVSRRVVRFTSPWNSRTLQRHARSFFLGRDGTGFRAPMRSVAPPPRRAHRQCPLSAPSSVLGALDPKLRRGHAGPRQHLPLGRLPAGSSPLREPLDARTIHTARSLVGSDRFPGFGYTRRGYDVFHRCKADRRWPREAKLPHLPAPRSPDGLSGCGASLAVRRRPAPPASPASTLRGPVVPCWIAARPRGSAWDAGGQPLRRRR